MALLLFEVKLYILLLYYTTILKKKVNYFFLCSFSIRVFNTTIPTVFFYYKKI